MKSGNLNFLEPSGPLQACKGTDLPLPYRHTIFRSGRMRGPVAIFRSQKGSASEFGKQCFKEREVLVFTRVTLHIKEFPPDTTPLKQHFSKSLLKCAPQPRAREKQNSRRALAAVKTINILAFFLHTSGS